MPIYTFKCEECCSEEDIRLPSEQRNEPQTGQCGHTLRRDFLADIRTIEFDTSGCRDHNVIPREKRVYRNVSKSQADRVEANFKKGIEDRRRLLKDGNRGSIRQTHAIPADLYHGKIRETKDRNYWSDQKNLKKHKDFQVG